ncbi:hypothetical protein ACFP7A_03225 [Sporolactobacillus kofuensis]|uniref:DUF1328 domain-containing protein n=1 Tax=Sporolactobacillus kofuensis TaxID=269672 RepID=A0ABW1WDK6_9BACL|nr:hypothetical protein [Sporolactobacillus kofuensis]MCO7174586.1 hypothetical protein [Sporolactobacillus kofuensis]
MFRSLYILFLILTAAGLIGVAAGMVYGQPLFMLLCAFAVILFMWLSFMIKAMQQKKENRM